MSEDRKRCDFKDCGEPAEKFLCIERCGIKAYTWTCNDHLTTSRIELRAHHNRLQNMLYRERLGIQNQVMEA